MQESKSTSVLLVGSASGAGSREIALAWKLSQSPLLDKLYFWPGNGVSHLIGTNLSGPHSENLLPPPSQKENWDQAASWCHENHIKAVICGPETPLADGLGDFFREKGLFFWGPGAAEAQLEGSKAYAKALMKEAAIPTAAYQICQTQEKTQQCALDMIERKGGAVIKASGLAGGKGVFVCQTPVEVKQAIQRLYSDPASSMTSAAETVVVEEVLKGRECSYFTFIHGDRSSPLGFAVDFKRLQDGDQGPNTGGMGCYTPVPWLPKDATETVEKLIVQPLLKTLNERGQSYLGWLYVGLMWPETSEDKSQMPQVVEFNVRLGDPEAQILAVHDKNTDWLARILDLNKETLETPASDSNENITVGVVLASSTYPFGSSKDAEKAWLPLDFFSTRTQPPRDNRDTSYIFGASLTETQDHAIATGHGRVLTIVAQAEDIQNAREQAYKKVSKIRELWPHCQFRTDIGAKLLPKDDQKTS